MFVGAFLVGSKWKGVHVQFTDSTGAPADPTGTPTVKIGKLDPTGGSATFAEISGSPFNLAKLLTQTGWYGAFLDLSALGAGHYLCRISGTVSGVSVAGVETFLITDDMVSAAQAARLDATVSSRATQTSVDTVSTTLTSKASQASVDTKASQASVDALAAAVSGLADRRVSLLVAVRGGVFYAKTWLTSGGEIDTTGTASRITIYKEDGSVLIATLTDAVPDSMGMFTFSQSNPALLESTNYIAKCEIDTPTGTVISPQGFVIV